MLGIVAQNPSMLFAGAACGWMGGYYMTYFGDRLLLLSYSKEMSLCRVVEIAGQIILTLGVILSGAAYATMALGAAPYLGLRIGFLIGPRAAIIGAVTGLALCALVNYRLGLEPFRSWLGSATN